MESMFGFSLEEFVETPDFWERRMAPEDLPRFLTAFAGMRESHGQMSVEYRVTARDGREVWVRDIGIVERDDDGEFYVHGHLTDVTREKELERELAAERAQAEAFFRDSPTGMGISDREGRYLRLNEALARMNGATMEDHLGRRSPSSPDREGRPSAGRPAAAAQEEISGSSSSWARHVPTAEGELGRRRRASSRGAYGCSQWLETETPSPMIERARASRARWGPALRTSPIELGG